METIAAFSMPVRVYLEDTDAQGFVYNASYFRFMERARTECLRERGIDHDELRERFGVNVVLASINANFRAPAKLSDLLSVSADICEMRGARIVFRHAVHRGADADVLVCDGTADVACMDVATGRPRRIPAEVLSEWS